MAKTAIRTARAPQPAGPYSQAIEAGGVIYTAGFGPQDPQTGEVAPTVAEQTRQALRNIGAVLEERGLTLKDCVRTTVHLADLADFAEFNAAYGEFFSEPYPVRTTVGSELSGIRVEINAIAVRPER
ncbi:MAG TPA: Rid family detoxifying hydrolase [Microbacteriaceae bacterium]|nr:Rid family detoxifying hydrolase [Microbacteriaceae bacterium]